MTRINTNIASMTALRNLTQSQMSLNRSLERLSSGFKINHGGDDPAGLVISERLRAQIASLTQAVDNTQRADNMVSTTEGALIEVNSLLLSVKNLALQAANTGALSSQEVAADQAQIDSAVDSINRIASTAKFSSQRLLNGSLAYTLSTNTPLSALHDLRIDSLAFGNTSVKNIQVKMTTSAKLASVTSNRKGTSAGSAITLQITGNKGTEVITLGASTHNSAIVLAVNAVKDNTGVSAITSTTISGGVFFYSTEFGKNQFVSVRDLDTDGNNVLFINKRASGQDAAINVNGISAATAGLTADLNTSTLKLHVRVDRALALNTVKAFDVHGGGAKFQVGDTTAPNEQVNVGINQIYSYNLGDSTNGFLNTVVTGGTNSLANNPSAAAKIIDSAIDNITTLRARLGAIDKNTFQTNLNTLGVAITELSDAESRIRDTDFAKETANFTKSQILVQAGTSILAQANLTPQSVLALLGGR